MIKPKQDYDSSFSILYDLLLQQNEMITGISDIKEEINNSTPSVIEVIKEVEVEKPVEVIKEVVKQVIVEKPVEVIKEVVKQVMVEKPVEVVKVVYKYRDGQVHEKPCTCNSHNVHKPEPFYAEDVTKHSKQPVMRTIIPKNDGKHDIHCCQTIKRKKCIIIGI